MSGRSAGTNASRSTIDAIFSTSYGVRFFERAYAMPTVRQRLQNVWICIVTSCFDVVAATKS